MRRIRLTKHQQPLANEWVCCRDSVGMRIEIEKTGIFSKNIRPEKKPHIDGVCRMHAPIVFQDV